MSGSLHLLKLCVGADALADLAHWQETVARRNRDAGHGAIVTHTTRMWPRREAELLDGGSLYWVIRGAVRARQRLLGLEERVGADGIRRCALVLEPDLHPTAPQPRRPFQGWRYLKAADAPADLAPGEGENADLPPALAEELVRLGVL